jgi:hypothetical protein
VIGADRTVSSPTRRRDRRLPPRRRHSELLAAAARMRLPFAQPSCREAVLEARVLHDEILCDMLREAQELGDVPETVDLQLATAAVMGMRLMRSSQ